MKTVAQLYKATFTAMGAIAPVQVELLVQPLTAFSAAKIVANNDGYHHIFLCTNAPGSYIPAKSRRSVHNNKARAAYYYAKRELRIARNSYNEFFRTIAYIALAHV